jgi:hypothetical protein
MAVGHEFAHHRQRRRPRRCDFADDAAEIERQLGVELARKLLHALVIGEARHVQQPDAAIARGEQRAAEQRRTDAMALPRLLHAQRRLRLARKSCTQGPQFRDAAQNAVDEEAVHDGVERGRQLDIPVHELVGDRAAEPVIAAFGVEPQQMVAILVGLADPQLADHAAFGKDVLHFKALQTLIVTVEPSGPFPQAHPADATRGLRIECIMLGRAEI